MAITYEPIATTTLSSTQNTITFNSISSAYTDLRVVLVGSITTGNDRMGITFNGNTSSSYSSTFLLGNGASASSGRTTSVASINVSSQNFFTTTPSLNTIDIFNYANTGVNKTVLINNSSDTNGSGFSASIVGMWQSTSAITSISMALILGGQFSIGTKATIYGILKA